jgi:hypothetical protein
MHSTIIIRSYESLTKTPTPMTRHTLTTACCSAVTHCTVTVTVTVTLSLFTVAQRNECDFPEECLPERYDDPQCPLNRPYGFAPFAGGEVMRRQ